MFRYQKGDIVTYSNGIVKVINKPNKYEKYFNDDYYNPTYDLRIDKIQRYKKILCFYILETIYVRREK